jgi:hypothetical protein
VRDRAGGALGRPAVAASARLLKRLPPGRAGLPDRLRNPLSRCLRAGLNAAVESIPRPLTDQHFRQIASVHGSD